MKNVVITGSTRGIGLCMAKEFLAAGCNITLSGRGAELSTETQAALEQFVKQYIYIACNTQSLKDIETLWAESAKKWGRVDIWINNAGQNCPYEKIWDTDPAFIDKVVDTNLKGVLLGSSIAATNMLKQGSGQIFNMEGLGSDGRIMEKTILYGTTKRALAYFTRGLAKELSGSPVLAGRLSPGMMLTDFITKGPDGKESPALAEKRFQYVMNAIGERPEKVAAFLVPRMLANKKNDAHIVWLTNAKATIGFLFAPMRKRKLI